MLNGATGQPFRFKFTANVGNWWGYGYGDTKCEAFRAFARGVPKPERRRVIQEPCFGDVEPPLTIDGEHGYCFASQLLASEISCIHWAARDPEFRWCRISKRAIDDALDDHASTSEGGGRIEPR
jgi:hypothetical protein